MHHDIRGLPQTAASAEAMAAFDATVEAYLAFELQTGDRLKETLSLDPAMPLALCLKGCFLMLFAKRDLAARAAKALADAKAAGAETGLTPREAQHLAGLEAWLGGDLSAAAACWDAVLADHPQDIVALKLAQYLHFYLGDAPAMRRSVSGPCPPGTKTWPATDMSWDSTPSPWRNAATMPAPKPAGATRWRATQATSGPPMRWPM